nr:hypothetical protein [Tanacetum cinerariifolium]
HNKENLVTHMDNNFHHSSDCNSVPIHRQTRTVVDNHNYHVNYSHINCTNNSRPEVVEGSWNCMKNKHFDIPLSSRRPAKPLDDNSRILTVKVVDDMMFLCQDFCPPNPPSFQIRKTLYISYLIGALKLLSFILNAQ